MFVLSCLMCLHPIGLLGEVDLAAYTIAYNTAMFVSMVGCHVRLNGRAVAPK